MYVLKPPLLLVHHLLVYIDYQRIQDRTIGDVICKNNKRVIQCIQIMAKDTRKMLLRGTSVPTHKPNVSSCYVWLAVMFVTIRQDASPCMYVCMYEMTHLI